jgi:hypothetical protein
VPGLDDIAIAGPDPGLGSVVGPHDRRSGYAVALMQDHAPPLPAGRHEATGFSSTLSVDEAFAHALVNLPPLDLGGTADALVRLQVVEIGGLFGGIAGFTTCPCASAEPTTDRCPNRKEASQDQNDHDPLSGRLFDRVTRRIRFPACSTSCPLPGREGRRDLRAPD